MALEDHAQWEARLAASSRIQSETDTRHAHTNCRRLDDV